jgi:signal peptidase II
VFDLFASGLVLLLLDQWSKRIVELRVPDGCVSYGPFLRIRCATNGHPAYNRNGPRAVLVLIWLAALISAIILHRSGAWFQSWAALVGLGLALGGGAGNLLDILWRRSILDFIDLRWWPVFNLADVGIVAGLTIALWSLF